MKPSCIRHYQMGRKCSVSFNPICKGSQPRATTSDVSHCVMSAGALEIRPFL